MNDDWLSLRGSSVESFPFGMSPTVNRDNREVVLSDCHVYVWMWIPVTLSHLQSISYWRWRGAKTLVTPVDSVDSGGQVDVIYTDFAIYV